LDWTKDSLFFVSCCFATAYCITNKHKHTDKMDSCDKNCNSSNAHTCKGEFKGRKRVGGPLTDGKKNACQTHQKTVDTNTKMLGDLGLDGYKSLPPEALFPMLGQLVSNLADKLMDLTNVEDKHQLFGSNFKELVVLIV
jgi:hypothetical protein